MGYACVTEVCSGLCWRLWWGTRVWPAGLEAFGFPRSIALGGVGHTNHPDLGDLISPSLAK